ncbi:MAG: LysR substrate-binding domain-containing protein, partial [Pseudomonadota bacterium]
LKAGFGISMLPEVLCDTEEGVEKVLPDLPPLQFPIWLVTHRELQTSPRIRIVFDQLARGLKEAAAPLGD